MKFDNRLPKTLVRVGTAFALCTVVGGFASPRPATAATVSNKAVVADSASAVWASLLTIFDPDNSKTHPGGNG